MKNNSDFLKEHQLEIVVYEPELDRVRHILKELNETYILNHTETEDRFIGTSGNRYIFHIHCPTTNFALGFFWLGVRMHEIYAERERIRLARQKQ